VVGRSRQGQVRALNRRSEYAFERRTFAGAGVAEDPVCGSINAAVAPWCLRTGAVSGGYRIAQGQRVDRASWPRGSPQVDHAQLGLDERHQAGRLGGAAQAVEGAPQKTEVHGADDLWVIASHSTEGASAECDVAAAPSREHLGCEPETLEQAAHVRRDLLDRDLLDSDLLDSVAVRRPNVDELPRPLLADLLGSRRPFVRGVGQTGGEQAGEILVLATAWLPDGQRVCRAGPAESVVGAGLAHHQTHATQGLEMKPDGRGVQPYGLAQLMDVSGGGVGPQELQEAAADGRSEGGMDTAGRRGRWAGAHETLLGHEATSGVSLPRAPSFAAPPGEPSGAVAPGRTSVKNSTLSVVNGAHAVGTSSS
jgi:hypothetical protein